MLNNENESNFPQEQPDSTSSSAYTEPAEVQDGRGENQDLIEEDREQENMTDKNTIRNNHDNDGEISNFGMLGYGLGHVYNDLCASMWFTYLMLFLQKVLKFHSYRAGAIMLIGQVTDAISTPLVGLASDRSALPNFCLRKCGRRKAWHLLGTICVTVSFPFIFNRCFFCPKSPISQQWLSFFWFVPFVMLFQFGWASVQIAHLSLIPELSRDVSRRVTMNSLRYGGTVLANLVIFGILACFLSVDAGKALIGPADFVHFRNAALIAVGIGLVFSGAFHILTKESRHSRRLSRLQSTSGETVGRMTWKLWFLQSQFYMVAALYMLSRLYINISQVYFPFYIQWSQNFTKEYVAYLPMITYLTSFVISTAISVPFLNRHLSKKFLYATGALCALGNCYWMSFANLGSQIFAVSVVQGVSQAILLVASLTITADLINTNTESGAFVYGAMSFADKLANGIAFQIIELLNPACDPNKPHEACARFYSNVMVFVPGICALLAIFVIIILMFQRVGQRSANGFSNNSVIEDLLPADE